MVEYVKGSGWSLAWLRTAQNVGNQNQEKGAIHMSPSPSFVPKGGKAQRQQSGGARREEHRTKKEGGEPHGDPTGTPQSTVYSLGLGEP